MLSAALADGMKDGVFDASPPEEWQPRRHATGLDPFREVRTACSDKDFPGLLEYATNDLFPEVPHAGMEPTAWHTVLMGPWSALNEHITLKEGRALVLSVRRMARARATNFVMLRITQQLSALSLLGHFQLRVRWVPSEWNVADSPSRGCILPGAESKMVASLPATGVCSKFDGHTASSLSCLRPASDVTQSAGDRSPTASCASRRK